MDNLLSPDALNIAIMFIVPGYIISIFRAHFIVGQKAQGVDYSIKLITLSALNFLVSGWMIYLAIAWNWDAALRAFVWLVVLGISPALLGILSGCASKKQWARWFYDKLGLEPLHVMPTSWDYQFSNLKGTWLFVVLKDDTTFAGYWGGRSFASSDSARRDLLIEKVYDVPEEGPWIETKKSLLISAGEIRTIEFIPVD